MTYLSQYQDGDGIEHSWQDCREHETLCAGQPRTDVDADDDAIDDYRHHAGEHHADLRRVDAGMAHRSVIQ